MSKKQELNGQFLASKPHTSLADVLPDFTKPINTPTDDVKVLRRCIAQALMQLNEFEIKQARNTLRNGLNAVREQEVPGTGLKFVCDESTPSGNVRRYILKRSE